MATLNRFLQQGSHFTPPPALTPPRPFRLRGMRRELRDTFTLELDPSDGSSVTPFSAGQFNMLYLFGIGEAAISISGDPLKGSPLVHTVRAVGAVSRALCALKRGAMVGVRGPFGAFWPVAESEGKDIVLIAGGIGLAPIRPALYHIVARRKRYGRVALLVGARSPEELLYAREVERWRGRFDLEVLPTVDRAARDWRGDVGVVTTLIPRATFDPARTVAFVCGPEVMMRFAATALVDRGLAAESIYLSMERNMKCAVGLCGHCQFGAAFICKDGPVFPYSHLEPLLRIREL
jgi:NAD(P)H-flavin reductase